MNPSQAYLVALREVLHNNGRTTVRGQKTIETTNAKFDVLRPNDSPIKTKYKKRNEVIAKYTAAEFELYRSGTLKASDFGEHAPFWLQLADDAGNVVSNYGRMIWHDLLPQIQMTQWDYVAELLRRDPYTRQAVLYFGGREYQSFESKDIPCTLTGTFLYRYGHLHLTMVMRSNDVVKGLVYDMPWFNHLLITMAAKLSLKVGIYTHIAHSMHIYERDLELALKMLGDRS